jgi:endoglucanase
MKLIRNVVACAALAFAAAASGQTSTAGTAPALGTESPFHRGVNVLGYDPYWQDSSKAHFQWRHYAEIRRAGFDFVRLNLQAFQFMDAQNRLDPKWLAKLDAAVNEATKAGLGIIIDEHDFNACAENLDLCRTKLSAFWEQVAPR